MKNINYKISPFNLLAIAFIVFSIIMYENDGGKLSNVHVIVLVPSSIVLLFIDFFIQEFTKTYFSIFAWEFLLLGLCVLFIIWTIRAKTLILPIEFDKDYVTIIYGVKNKKKLPSKYFPYELEIPKSGVYLTSSTFDKDLSNTKIINYYGDELDFGSEDTNLRFLKFLNDTIRCNETEYVFYSWEIYEKHNHQFHSTPKENQHISDLSDICSNL